MKTNIILAGVGGQGILTIATILDYAAMQKGLYIKQAEVHGMSQRGGAVQSHLRISDSEIYSDLIQLGTADLILSVEPMEALRYLPFLSPEGNIVTAIEPFTNIPNYPELEDVLNTIKSKKNAALIDSMQIAKEAGNARTNNIAMLGAAAKYTGIDQESLEEGIRFLFGKKGDKIVDMNIAALRMGIEATK